MGYYSYYTFWIEDVPGDYKPLTEDKEIMSFIEKNNGYGELLYAIDNECKFYEYHDTMKNLSTIFPDKLFRVYREGEESADLEESFYKNNKMVSYIAKVIFPQFNIADMI
jgi:hypothetical protein